VVFEGRFLRRSVALPGFCVRSVAPASDACTSATCGREAEVDRIWQSLTAEDLSKISSLQPFHLDGLDLRFQVLVETMRRSIQRLRAFCSRPIEPEMQNYLADEETFLWMNSSGIAPPVLSRSPRIPGPSRFSRKRMEGVHVLYLGPGYLFGQSSGRRTFRMRALPFSNAVYPGLFSSRSVHPQAVPGHRSTSLVQDVRLSRMRRPANSPVLGHCEMTSAEPARDQNPGTLSN
jgi:hypothetical protein